MFCKSLSWMRGVAVVSRTGTVVVSRCPAVDAVPAACDVTVVVPPAVTGRLAVNGASVSIVLAAVLPPADD